MLVIINCIFALIFFFIFLIMLHSEPSFIKLAIVLTALLINIVCVVTIISSFKYTIDIKLSDEVKSSQNIVNFKDNRDLQGGFFIGCGEVNTEQYYYYYYKTDKGSYKASKIKADDCEIIYTKDTPHIDTIVKSADEKQLKIRLLLNLFCRSEFQVQEKSIKFISLKAQLQQIFRLI